MGAGKGAGQVSGSHKLWGRQCYPGDVEPQTTHKCSHLTPGSQSTHFF